MRCGLFVFSAGEEKVIFAPMPPSMMYSPPAPVYESCIIPVNMCNSNSMMGGMNYNAFSGGNMFGNGMAYAAAAAAAAAASNTNYVYGAANGNGNGAGNQVNSG